MKVRAIAPLALALALLAGTASAASIGVFFDTGAGICSGPVPVGPWTLYAMAILSGPSAGGMTGAEFRIDGIPSGWFPAATANPAAPTNVGSPVAPTNPGCNIAFAGCQISSPVLLYTLTGYNSIGTSPATYITVNRHTTPSNPLFFCPLQVLCDAPVYTKVCVSGGVAIANGPACTVGVEPKSWSSVKSLFN